jgi:hypothetical protein
MPPYTTPHTGPRCRRLADRATSESLPTTLVIALPLVLLHPAAPLAGLLLYCARRLGRRADDRSPHRRGNARPSPTVDRP